MRFLRSGKWLGDRGYDSDAHRDELRQRRILPGISPKGSPNIGDRARSATLSMYSVYGKRHHRTALAAGLTFTLWATWFPNRARTCLWARRPLSARAQ